MPVETVQTIGDLQKILSKSDNYKEFMKDNKVNIEELAKLSKKEKNKKICEYFENFGKNSNLDKKSIDESITKIMKGSKTAKINKIMSFARGLNSIPAVITTFLISPYILGWFIPRLTYANTRRMHEKSEKEKELKSNSSKINAAV